mgnify:CR=1 FL=1
MEKIEKLKRIFKIERIDVYDQNKPLQSDFLENFMVIGFGDIGTAWTGKNPYSSDNSFNTSIGSIHRHIGFSQHGGR